MKKRLVSLKKDLGYSTEFVEVMKKILKKDEHDRYSVDQLSVKLKTKRGLGGRNSIGSLHLEQSPIPHRYGFGGEEDSMLNFTGFHTMYSKGNSGEFKYQPHGVKVEKMEETQKTQASSHFNQNYSGATGFSNSPNSKKYRQKSPGMNPGQYGHPVHNSGHQMQYQQHNMSGPGQYNQYPGRTEQTPHKNQNGYSNGATINNITQNSHGSYRNPLAVDTSRNNKLRGTQGSFGKSGQGNRPRRGTSKGKNKNPLHPGNMHNGRNGALRGSYGLRGSHNIPVQGQIPQNVSLNLSNN